MSELDVLPRLLPLAAGVAFWFLVYLTFSSTRELRRELAEHARTARALAEERERLEADLEAAAAVQRSLLPAPDLELPGLRVAWRFLPCETVGGDLFNIFPLNESFSGFYCLDVSGHGIQAALTSVALSRLLSTWGAETSLMVTPSGRIRWPREVVEILNQRFYGDAGERQFFTIVYALINHRTRMLSYVRAGHPLPFVVSPGAAPKFLEGGDLPIGFSDAARFTEFQHPFPSGSRLYLYSDGITEALRPSDRERFGTERLAEAILGTPGTLAETCEGLLRSVADFQAHEKPRDDVSLLAVEIL